MLHAPNFTWTPLSSCDWSTSPAALIVCSFVLPSSISPFRALPGHPADRSRIISWRQSADLHHCSCYQFQVAAKAAVVFLSYLVGLGARLNMIFAGLFQRGPVRRPLPPRGVFQGHVCHDCAHMPKTRLVQSMILLQILQKIARGCEENKRVRIVSVLFPLLHILTLYWSLNYSNQPDNENNQLKLWRHITL